jgi:hypothetical protein
MKEPASRAPGPSSYWGPCTAGHAQHTWQQESARGQACEVCYNGLSCQEVCKAVAAVESHPIMVKL